MYIIMIIMYLEKFNSVSAAMRRSAAPSQLASASKRPRFTPPFANKPISNTSPCNSSSHMLNQHSPDVQSSESIIQSTSNRTVPSVLTLIQEKSGSVDQHPSNNLGSSSQLEIPKAEVDIARRIAGSLLAKENRSIDRKTGTSVQNRLSVDNTLNSPLKNQYRVQSVSEIQPECNDGKQPHYSIDTSKLQSTVSSSSCSSLKPRTSTSVHCGAFRQPLLRKPDIAKTVVQEKSEEENETKYFSVVWCKLSKKKHKKWEGDAILVTKGKFVSLLDTEGKEIGKGRGYKSSELKTMVEGHTLVIGGKEIEVMGEISRDDFTSGKCFQTTSVTQPPLLAVLSKPSPPAPKPFTNPQKSGNMSSAGDAGVKFIETIQK